MFKAYVLRVNKDYVFFIKLNVLTENYETTCCAKERCSGVPKTRWACCSAANPCTLGGGDCDNDNECEGNLMCGKDNCRPDFSTTGSNWHKAADCCTCKYAKKYFH